MSYHYQKEKTFSLKPIELSKWESECRKIAGQNAAQQNHQGDIQALPTLKTWGKKRLGLNI